jgi:hypothetical protein
MHWMHVYRIKVKLKDSGDFDADILEFVSMTHDWPQQIF